jgi:hypothetical protein
MIKWFAVHNLVLNLDRINKMNFITKNSSHSILHIGYKENYIEQTLNAKLFGSQIDIHINWKNPIEQIIPKLSRAFHSARSMVHVSNINILKSIYYAYFHSIIKYGIIFWGSHFQQWEAFHFTKEIHENYGWCTIQNLR